MSSDEITVFVAMPYTDLGEHAKWRKPIKVIAFYEQVRRHLEQELGRPVRLHIEKDIPKSGLVMGEMFRAIQGADVFIADITGSNANVFLELGVRYGVSDKVTILTTQEDRPPPFDVNQIAVVRYADGPTQEAEQRIADIVKQELDSLKGGSPVLALLEATVVPRRQWEICSGSRIELLIAQSRSENESRRKIEIIKQALEIDPLSLSAAVELVTLLRSARQLEAALCASDRAIRLFPRSASLLKERGMILDRLSSAGEDLLDESIQAFTLAIRIEPDDGDLHGCLGGVLRRKALQSTGGQMESLLAESIHHYHKSIVINRHSSYAGMNLMRLLMLGAKPPADLPGSEQDHLNRMFHLCAFEVSDAQRLHKREAWWPMFDLGDIQTLRDEPDLAIQTYKEAINLIPPHSLADTLLSPLRTWQELLNHGAMQKKQVRNNADKIVSLIESCKGT